MAFSSAVEDMEPPYQPDQLLEGVSLGLDFEVDSAVEVTALGIFDWENDGVASAHRVSIFALDGSTIATIEIQAGEGYLLNGFRFVDLATPVRLDPGFAGTIAAGFAAGNQDRNANVHGDQQIDPPPVFDGGSGQIRNVGVGRYGGDPDGFPDTPDLVHGGGPENRYHAGSFCFRAAR